jgi:hypothetical protein
MDINETHDEGRKELIAVVWPYRRKGEAEEEAEVRTS